MLNYLSSISPRSPHNYCVSFCETKSPLEKKPRVIFLGEMDDYEDNYIGNAFVIHQLYKNGDIVLVELSENDPNMNGYIQKRFLKNSLFEIHGWDDKAAHDTFCKVKEKVSRFQRELKQQLTYQDDWTKQAIELFQDLDQGAPAFTKMALLKIKSIYKAFKHCSQVSQSIERTKSLKDFLVAIKPFWTKCSKSFEKAFSETFMIRQKSLIEKIQRHLKEDNTVFVVTENVHIFTDKERGVLQENLRVNHYSSILSFYLKNVEDVSKRKKNHHNEGVSFLRAQLLQQNISFHAFWGIDFKNMDNIYNAIECVNKQYEVVNGDEKNEGVQSPLKFIGQILRGSPPRSPKKLFMSPPRSPVKTPPSAAKKHPTIQSSFLGKLYELMKKIISWIARAIGRISGFVYHNYFRE